MKYVHQNFERFSLISVLLLIFSINHESEFNGYIVEVKSFQLLLVHVKSKGEFFSKKGLKNF